jgi:hypothetical protein
VNKEWDNPITVAFRESIINVHKINKSSKIQNLDLFLFQLPHPRDKPACLIHLLSNSNTRIQSRANSKVSINI